VYFFPSSSTSRLPPVPRRDPHGRGFTLLELLLVLGLAAILVALVLGGSIHANRQARAARARVELATIASALAGYARQHGDFPRTDDTTDLLRALLGRRSSDGAVIAAPPLIDAGQFELGGDGDPSIPESAELRDPWGQRYRYAYKSQLPWTNPGFVLYSCGPDQAATEVLLAGGFADRAAPGNADNLWEGEP
jgi:prepilin-type N-terminal cleavage/methylation domain-containing protein